MDFSISKELRELCEGVRDFVQTRLWPLEPDIEAMGYLENEAAQELLQYSRDKGFYAMNMPKEVGGRGLGTVETCLVEMEIGQTVDVLMRRAFGNVYDILLECQGSQRERWLIPAVKGDRVCGIAMTEPGAGSDAAGISTAATADGSRWKLNGEKRYIGDAVTADFFVVTAVTTPGARSRGISLFLVDKSLPGVLLGDDISMMGMRGMPISELSFEDVILGPEHMLGEPDSGLALLLNAFSTLRLYHIGARGVGMARRALDIMIEYSQQRHQFGKPIGEHQMIQTMLADSIMEWNAARLMVLEAAWDIDQGHNPREKISMVKVYVAETLGRIADRAVQILGARGYSNEYPIERIYRDSRVWRIFDGTSEVHRGVIAKGLLEGGVGEVV